MKIYLKLAIGITQVILLLLLISISTLGFFPKLNFYTVNSGSMEPTIKTGSLIYTVPYRLDELKTGDIITFISGQTQPTVVTHRIADIKKIQEKITLPGADKNTKEKLIYEITTKGDANQTPDTNTVSPNQILGKYRLQIPLLGYLINYAKSPSGFFLLIVLPIIALITGETLEIITYMKHFYERQTEEKIKLALKQAKTKP